MLGTSDKLIYHRPFQTSDLDEETLKEMYEDDLYRFEVEERKSQLAKEASWE